MKNPLVGLFIVCTLFVLVTAQHAVAQTWDLRLYGGMSNAEFYGGSKAFGGDSKNGLALGVGAEFVRHDDDPFGFEFGAWYVGKGAKGTIEVNPVDPIQPPEPDLNFQGTVDIGYLQLEFLAVGHLYTSKTTEVRMYLGPSMGNLLFANAEGTSNGQPVDVDIKDAVKQFDWGWTIGAGFGYDVGRVILIADVRVILGISSIAEGNLESDLNTRTLVGVIGVQIPLTPQ